MKSKKKIERDRYFDEKLPSNNYDFVEVLVGDLDALDQYIYSSPQVQQVLGTTFQGDIPSLDKEHDKERSQKKQARLLRKVLQAASQTLTDRQFQIFTLRFIFGLTEEEVAKRITRNFVGRPRLDNQNKKAPVHPRRAEVSQPYVVQVLRTSIQKIQKILRIHKRVS